MPVVDQVTVNGVGPFLSIATVADTVPNVIANAKTGIYYAVPPFALSPRLSAPYYDDQDVVFPASNVVYTKRYGYRGQICTISLISIRNTKAQNEADKVAIWDALNVLNRYIVTIPGQVTLTGCKYVQNSFVVENIFTMSALIGQLFTFGVNVKNGPSY
jgi:hypothetical protein